MKYEDYTRIYTQLRKYDDIEHLHSRHGLDKELLLVLYTQRTVRDATRRFYIVKKDINKLAKEWRRGTSIARMARVMNFPPVLLGMMLSSEIGIPRKQFWKYVREPEHCKDSRLRREFKQMADDDMIYSPHGAQIQAQRGKLGEKKLQEWLRQRHLKDTNSGETPRGHK